jgi:hypothetical protein
MANILKNPVVPNPVDAALSALKGGNDVSAAVYGEQSSDGAGETIDASDVSSAEAIGDLMDGVESGDTEDTTGSESLSAMDEVTDNSEEAATSSDIEDVIVSDDSGRKKVKVDWNDREKLKKYVQMAAGMRKFQAERDRLNRELSDIQPKYKDLADSWQAIEEAFSSGGVRGLINLLGGSNDAYEKHIESEFSRLKARESASPSELERMDLEERLTNERREREKLARQVEDNLKKAQEKEETASMKALESIVHPAFDKHRFAGKLGDEIVEARLDQAVWDQALKRLEDYPDDISLTPSIVEKEFKEVANSFRKIINKQAEQKAQKVVTNKKVAAQEAAAAKAMNGYKPKTSQASEKFKSDIRGGNLVSALSDLMAGKVKF